MNEFFELIDARRSRWLTALENAVAAKKPAFLVAPGTLQSLRFLERVLNFRIETRERPRDMITCYDITQGLSKGDYDRLHRAYHAGDCIVLIEDFYSPRFNAGPGKMALACNIVRRLECKSNGSSKPINAFPDNLPHGGGDYLEAEVCFGYFDRSLLRRNPQAHLAERGISLCLPEFRLEQLSFN